MKVNNLRRIKNLSFGCPGADCTAVHNWPRSDNRTKDSIFDPFPLIMCSECDIFIEVHPVTTYDFFTGCIREQISITVMAFREYAEYVPEAVRTTLGEALRCRNVDAWHACAAMARKAVEIMAIDLSGQGRTLYDRLEDLKDRGLVARRFIVWEHCARNLGNLAVHYDPGDDRVGEAEADCALAYAYEVSKQVYLRRKAPEFKVDAQREEYLSWLNDLRWGERYGIAPIID